MKTSLFVLLALLFAVACPCFAQLSDDDCLDNCNDFTGDCRNCHITNGAAIWFADYTYICPKCSPSSAKTEPKVPFRAKPVDSVLAFLDAMTVKRDPKVARLLAMTPERHVELMRRAVRLGLDGPMLGACRKAFRVGTLAQLPGEILATEKRLREYSALR